MIGQAKNYHFSQSRDFKASRIQKRDSIGVRELFLTTKVIYSLASGIEEIAMSIHKISIATVVKSTV